MDHAMNYESESDSVARQRMFIRLVRHLGLDLGLDLGLADVDSEPLGIERSSGPWLKALDSSTFPSEYSLNSGEIQAVQDRFYALLKHRLQSEIQLNPPLFPWEQSMVEYQDDVPETIAAAGIDLRSLWLAQLRRLALPVTLPDAVLAQLLAQCQALMQQPLREGAKLVQAVEALFPGELRALNQMAGMVMVSPARSGYASLQEKLGGDFALDYEAAQPTQQMVLSLLAAREIFNALRLKVSAAQPMQRYEWATDAGVLVLQTHYRIDATGVSTLRVEAIVPCGSQLELRGADRRSLAESQDAGQLTVELSDLDVRASLTLTVRLGDDTLTFAIQPEA
jgi:hypothetical protein